MDSKEMLDILELAVAARSPLAPLDANKASRALLGLLDPRETEEAYETAASTHEGAEVFSEAADHLASLEKLSDAEVRAAILDGGTRSIVAQALSEVREAYAASGERRLLEAILEKVRASQLSMQAAKAALLVRSSLPVAAMRTGGALDYTWTPPILRINGELKAGQSIAIVPSMLVVHEVEQDSISPSIDLSSLSAILGDQEWHFVMA